MIYTLLNIRLELNRDEYKLIAFGPKNESTIAKNIINIKLEGIFSKYY